MCSAKRSPWLVAAWLGVVVSWLPGPARADDAPEVPRIDSVVMSPDQPQQSDQAVVWYDDFDGPEKPYTESQGELDEGEAFGGRGRSMLSVYEQGSRGVGNRKVFFGDSPTGKVVHRGESFEDVYWRIYVKHQHGWTGGGPAKLSRATSIVSPRWAQAMIAHVWSSGEALTLDPASGVRGDRVVTTCYNDFPNLRWLGNKPVSRLKLHGTEEAGRWVCVEARAKLNTPGKKDGLNQLWIDGRLEAERRNLDWRGDYTGHGINAVFLETYWNEGSPVTQKRWIDNFVISTRPIGPIVCARNPVLIKTSYHGPGKQAAWEAEIASDDQGGTVVWRSARLTAADRVRVGEQTGTFLGPLKGQTRLAGSPAYYLRVRQQNDAGRWSAWSPWHQPFRTKAGN
ncbi:MAG: hypothetical protein JXB62_18630 [Pirellulales bacterium]|nr:hypothetical protein [Pirellulales bacterium]